MRPTTEELSSYFEDLYKLEDQDELLKIEKLESKTYIPVLDDPISQKEVLDAEKDMKKGGYDFRLSSLHTIIEVISPLLLIILNILFYITYPISLATSLLFAIFKKGNSLLPQNYRGIQMLPAIGALYDRIITNRLNLWIGVNDEQSAFQKNKSTIQQLFVLRILISLAKKTDATLYIGYFDLEKAFDKVSRLLLLSKLIKLGIGSYMLTALKRIYCSTYSILHTSAESSTAFRTYTGIRQGAPSSVLLFIVFIDDLIDYLKTHCVEEPIIGILHCLLHADDTAVISTKRELFIKKCNTMLDYFHVNKLSLNLTKSSFMIINGKDNDPKVDLRTNSGILPYKSTVVYLGAIISDTGNLMSDVDKHTESKRSNITIKFNNFCSKN